MATVKSFYFEVISFDEAPSWKIKMTFLLAPREVSEDGEKPLEEACGSPHNVGSWWDVLD